MNHDQHKSTLQNDNVRRRFLKRLFGGAAALTGMLAVPAIARADEPIVIKPQGEPPVGPAGRRGGGMRGGAAGRGGAGAGTGGGGRGGPVTDTDQIAERLIAEFDKDKDGKLNREELASAIKISHERGRQGFTPNGRQSEQAEETPARGRARSRRGGGAGTGAAGRGRGGRGS